MHPEPTQPDVARPVPATARRPIDWRSVIIGSVVVAGALQAIEPLARQSGFVAALLLVAFGVAIFWRPELSLVLALTGYGVLDALLPESRLRFQVAMVLALFAVTAAAIMVRHLVPGHQWRRTRTVLDLPVVVITIYAAFSTLLGFMRGHDRSLVVFSSYHVLQWPVYYLIVTYTLNTPERLGLNWALTGSQHLLSTLISVFRSGRGGGVQGWLPVAMALTLLRKPLISGGWLTVAILICTFSIVRSGFRTIWVHAAVSVLWLAVVTVMRRDARLLAVSIGSAVAAAGLIAAFTLAPQLSGTHIGDVIAESLTRPGGYRLIEAAYGWQAFRESPIIGHGFGHEEKDAWIPDLGAYGTGPVYHLFHLIILTNQGVVGLILVLWLFYRAIFGREGTWLRHHFADHPWAAVGLALQARTVGAFFSAMFAAPRVSHFEWITLPTLSVLCAMWAMSATRTQRGDR